MQKRGDIVGYNNLGKPFFIAECKAPEVKITQDTFDQIARYNLQTNADYLMVTNGLTHFYCQMDHDAGAYHFLRNLPTAAVVSSFASKPTHSWIFLPS